MTTALIIGAGIAGASTALALHKAGIDSVVFEAHPVGADDVGAFLTLRPNGMDALRVLDVDEVVAGAAFPARRVEQLDGTGARLSSFELPTSATGNGSWTLTRAQLYRVLQDEAVARGIRIDHGKRLIDSTSSATDVIATFSDGSQERGDLLIGADGIHSVTRTLIDPCAPHPERTGMIIVYGYASGAPHPAPPYTYRMMRASGSSGAFFGYTTDPGGQSWWFARLSEQHSTGAHAEFTSRDWKHLVLGAVATDNPLAAEIVRGTDKRIVGGRGYDIPTLPRWSSERLTLAGDAAHAASPAAAQGASMAIEDAIVLAKYLRQLPVSQAFAGYEGLRRERVESLVAASAAISGPQGSGAATSQPKTPNWLDYPYIDWDTPIEGR